MASIDLDPSIKQSLKFLHSSSRDSTEQVRLLLDEMIKQNCGSAKTMSNVLPKKYLVEDRSEGSQKSKKSDKSHAKISPIQSQSPQRLQILERHDDDSANVMDGELAFDLLQEDLTCAVCRQIAVQAGNRLVECDACHALYHQDCHKPVISDNDVGSGWQCASCLSAQGYPVGNYNMASIRPVPMTTQSNVKTSPMRQPSSSASIKLVTSSSNPSSTSSKVITPNINIISADKRLQIMKKKAAKQQEIKRKHVK